MARRRSAHEELPAVSPTKNSEDAIAEVVACGGVGLGDGRVVLHGGALASGGQARCGQRKTHERSALGSLVAMFPFPCPELERSRNEKQHL
jgi:hypothetical protein